MKFIFQVTIKPGRTEEEYAQLWVRQSEIIQKEPGALGTRLHRRIGQPGKLLAIAEWKSKELRDAAMERLNNDPDLAPLMHEHTDYVDFELIGEFEHPEWTVLPPS